MTEVEAKAPVGDVAGCKALLDQLLGPGVELAKYDTYYSHPTEIDLRIRCTEGADFYTVSEGPATLTAKKKGGTDNMECNREVEISVDSAQNTESILTLIGYTPYIQKKKFGYRWESRELVYELVEIHSLGWFLEIEKVLALSSPVQDDIDQAYRDVVEAFAQVGISTSSFEDRYYTDMLKEVSLKG